MLSRFTETQKDTDNAVTYLRKAARGRPCQIRIIGVCNGDEATTCLAHFRLAGISGMGWKVPDLIGAHACSSCHLYVDSHKDDATQLDFAKACFRTLALLQKEGLIA